MATVLTTGLEDNHPADKTFRFYLAGRSTQVLSFPLVSHSSGAARRFFREAAKFLSGLAGMVRIPWWVEQVTCRVAARSINAWGLLGQGWGEEASR
jgi:hypothetical protein